MICDESTGQLQTFIVSTKISSMQGAIPTELGLLTQLQEIAISNSDYLTGSIPRDLKNIKGLIRLILESNALSGRIPSEITTFNRRKHF
jgi:Leucine-rich repeat (LRR) protein